MPSLVPVARYFDNPSAAVACSVMKQAGIPAFVFDQHLALMNVSLLVALGGIRIMVPAEHAKEARAILGVDDDLSPNEDEEDCPRCDASCAFRPASLVLGLLALFCAHVYFLYRRRRRICRVCGHKWRVESA